MRKAVLLLLVLSLVFAIGIDGCGKECGIDSDCAEKECFIVQCSDGKCVYSIVDDCCGNEVCEVGEEYPECAADCPDCDDANKCTADSYDYHKKECVNKITTDAICCGNGRCEKGENYENCVKDCPNCDDENDCTLDYYEYHKQECINNPIIPCCGNGICDEGAETFSSCSVDCLDCDDDNKLTSDSFNYETQLCENIITHYLIDDFEEGTGNWEIFKEEEWSTVTEAGNTFLKLGHNQANLKNEFDNCIFKFRFKRIEGNMHANIKQISIGKIWNRYLIGISGRGVDNLGKQVGDEFKTIKDIDSKLGEGWHTVEIRNYNNIINIYVNDVLSMKYKDTDNPILSGKLGFEVHTGGSPVNPEFLIDDVEVKIITAEDIIYP